MAFIPPRPPGPNPGQMAAQRAAQQAAMQAQQAAQQAAMQAQRAAQQAAMQAQQAARNASAGAYMAAQRARRAGGHNGTSAPAPSMIAGAERPSALASALRGALGGLAILLVFAVVDRFAAPLQMSGSLMLFAEATVALVAGYRVVAATERLGAALLCGLLIGVGLALLGFLSIMLTSPVSPSYMAQRYFSLIAVADIRTLVVVMVVALAGGAAAKIAYLFRPRSA